MHSAFLDIAYCQLVNPGPAAGMTQQCTRALAPPTSSIVALTVCMQLVQGCYATASGQLNPKSRPQTRDPGRLVGSRDLSLGL